jgi:hypothetical protein
VRTAQVKAAPAALHHHLAGVLEAQRRIQLEAREARLADRQLAIGKAQHVADPHLVLEQAQQVRFSPRLPCASAASARRHAGLRAHRLPERRSARSGRRRPPCPGHRARDGSACSSPSIPSARTSTGASTERLKIPDSTVSPSACSGFARETLMLSSFMGAMNQPDLQGLRC